MVRDNSIIFIAPSRTQAVPAWTAILDAKYNLAGVVFDQRALNVLLGEIGTLTAKCAVVVHSGNSHIFPGRDDDWVNQLSEQLPIIGVGFPINGAETTHLSFNIPEESVRTDLIGAICEV